MAALSYGGQEPSSQRVWSGAPSDIIWIFGLLFGIEILFMCILTRHRHHFVCVVFCMMLIINKKIKNFQVNIATDQNFYSCTISYHTRKGGVCPDGTCPRGTCPGRLSGELVSGGDCPGGRMSGHPDLTCCVPSVCCHLDALIQAVPRL